MTRAYQRISKDRKKRDEQELSKRKVVSSRIKDNDSTSRPRSTRSKGSNSMGLRRRGASSRRRPIINSSDEEEDENEEDNSDEEDSRNWEERCMALLDSVWQMKDASPFKAPVSPVDYPTYYSTIDTPMDLQTIKEDLSGGNYNSLSQFHKDMLLIFSNSKQFNTDKKSRVNFYNAFIHLVIV